MKLVFTKVTIETVSLATGGDLLFSLSIKQYGKKIWVLKDNHALEDIRRKCSKSALSICNNYCLNICT